MKQGVADIIRLIAARERIGDAAAQHVPTQVPRTRRAAMPGALKALEEAIGQMGAATHLGLSGARH